MARLGNCLLDSVANAWVDLYHAVFVSKQALAQEQQQIRVALVQKELKGCHLQLQKKEEELEAKIVQLEQEAVSRKRAKDLMGAKKKMLERRRFQAQLETLQNSIMTIQMHQSTIEGSVLNRTVLETLRASGDALRSIGASSDGLQAVDKLVSEVEEHMQSAAEISKVLSAGSVSGMVNSMAVDGVVIDEEELMKELDQLVHEEVEDPTEKLLNAPLPLPPTTTTTRPPRAKKNKNASPVLLETLSQ